MPDKALRTCAETTAAHVGKPVDAVVASWEGATAAVGANVRVEDGAAGTGERTHVCVLNPDGSVAALLHPGR